MGTGNLPAVHGVRRTLAVTVLACTVLLGACGDSTPTTAPSAPVESHASPDPPDGDPAPEGIDGVIAVTGLTNKHTQDPVDYPTYPPMGGDHFPVWWTCGFYDTVLADEPAVHSLEHGSVWIAYRPDADDAAVATMKQLVADNDHILASPYPGLRAPFVLTAWQRQLDLDSLDDPRVQQFLDAYLNAGEAPEPGVTCAGGLTQ